MRRIRSVVVVLSLAASARLDGQIPEWVTQVLAAARLPVSAAAARSAGVPDSAVRAVLDAMQRHNVSAGDARDVLDEERTTAQQHGPIGNFGAFVQSKLDAGLRGRDLAAAIRAEHEARGIGASHGGRGNGPDSMRANDSARVHGNPHDSTATRGKGSRTPPASKKPAPKAPPRKGAPATKGRPTSPDRS